MTTSTSKTPEQTPALMAILDVWEAYLDGDAGKEDVVGVLHQVGFAAEQHLEHLEALITQGRSSMDDPFVAQIGTAFARLIKAVGRLEQALEEAAPNETEFSAGLDMVRGATQALLSSHSQFLRDVQKDHWTECPSCQSRNSSSNTFCNNCRKPLPKTVVLSVAGEWSNYVAEEVTQIRTEDFSTTDNYRALESAVEGWADGRVQTRELRETVNRIVSSTEVHMRENRKLLEQFSGAGSEGLRLVEKLMKLERTLESAHHTLTRLLNATYDESLRSAVLRVRLTEYKLSAKELARLYFAIKSVHEGQAR